DRRIYAAHRRTTLSRDRPACNRAPLRFPSRGIAIRGSLNLKISVWAHRSRSSAIIVVVAPGIQAYAPGGVARQTWPNRGYLTHNPLPGSREPSERRNFNPPLPEGEAYRRGTGSSAERCRAQRILRLRQGLPTLVDRNNRSGSIVYTKSPLAALAH